MAPTVRINPRARAWLEECIYIYIYIHLSSTHTHPPTHGHHKKMPRCRLVLGPLNDGRDGGCAASTRRMYKQTYGWLLRHYDGPWDSTLPLQEFVDKLRRHRILSVARLRALQSIINRRLDPPLTGPRLRVPDHARDAPEATAKGIDKATADDDRSDASSPVLGPWLAAHHRALVADDPFRTALLQAYVQYMMPHPLRRDRIRTYVGYIVSVLFVVLDCRCTADLLRVRSDRVAAAIVHLKPGSPHVRRLMRVAWNHFVAMYYAAAGHVVHHHTLTLRTHDVERRVATPSHHTTMHLPNHPAHTAVQRTLERDHFDAAEIQALLALPSLCERDHIMLSILAETGLRRRAVAWLTIDGVFDAVGRCTRPVCRALEKGMVVRPFVLSESTAAQVAAYVRHQHPHDIRSPWMFPNPRDHQRPIHPATVNRVLGSACRALGLRGRHTHCHAIRKFVTVQLMGANNRIEDVAPGPRFVHRRRKKKGYPGGLPGDGRGCANSGFGNSS